MGEAIEPKPLSQDEMKAIWLKLFANGLRDYTHEELTEILGTELMDRFQATVALAMRMPVVNNQVN